MSKWDKLIEQVLKQDRNMRFESIAKVLIRIGYTQHQPKSGSSHYTFRKTGKQPITIPKSYPINKAYIELVRDAIIVYESEEAENE